MSLPFHPSLNKLPKSCTEWLDHARKQADFEQYAADLQEYLNEPGRLHATATNQLRWLGHCYSVAACDAYFQSDVAEVAKFMRWSVAFGELEFRWRGALNIMHPEVRNFPSEFQAGSRASGPAMLSNWGKAAACAYFLIQIVHKDQRPNALREMHWFRHGTNDAFLVYLFSEAFGIDTHFKPFKPLIPEYQVLLDNWKTRDEAAFRGAMQAAAEFHISRSKPSTGSKFYEFDLAFDQLFPAELLAVQALRRRDSLPEFDTGHLLIDAPWAIVRDLPEVEPHPLAAAVEARLKQDYPLFR